MRVAMLEADEVQSAYVSDILSRAPVGEDPLVCHSFTSGQRLRTVLRHETYDLLILDWSVPDMDGIDLLQWLRNFQKSDMPVMMLAERGSETDVARAFGNGADDYAIKPLRPVEFCARACRLLRRKAHPAHSQIFTFGDWTLDRAGNTARFASERGVTETVLTEREFRLAVALFQHAGTSISRSHLLERSGVSGDEMGSRALDSHVYRLRHKLFSAADNRTRLQTIYGYGYRLEMLAEVSRRDSGAWAPSHQGAMAAMPS